MSAGRRLTALLVGVLLALAGLSTAASAATQKVPLLEMEANLMCTSCHEPLELANSPQAVSEKGYLKGLIAQGLTKSQIENRMVGQYGVSVLGKPPAKGFNLTVYILPPAILVVGVAFLVYTLPKWRERSRRAAETPLAGKPPLDPADTERIDDDLAHFI